MGKAVSVIKLQPQITLRLCNSLKGQSREAERRLIKNSENRFKDAAAKEKLHEFNLNEVKLMEV